MTATGPDILEVIADLSNDEVFTPPKVANAVLDLLPDDVWTNPDLRWLDPGAKTGVFLREVTKRLLVGLEPAIPDEQVRLTHILTKMVFGIAITELTSLMTRRTVYCSKDASSKYSTVPLTRPSGNIWFSRMEHPYNARGRCPECGAAAAQLDRGDARENYYYSFIHKDGLATARKEIDMKFDVIVGNPPYQMETSQESKQAKPLYNLFVEQAKSLNPRYIAMIIQSRWMVGGMGLDSFRSEMLTDARIRRLVDFPNSTEVFPGTDFKGGVCYFLWDRDSPGACEVTLVRDGKTYGPHRRDLDEFDVFVRDQRSLSVLRKVLARSKSSMYEVTSAQKPFGFPTNFGGTSTGSRPDDVKLYKGGGTGYVARDDVAVNSHWVDEWKLLMPKAGPGNSGGHVLPDVVLSRPIVAAPGSCCTETYTVVGPFGTEEETRSAESYVRTRFFRFLVSLRKASQDALRSTYGWVPQQSWDRTWTDEALYEKYGITEDEQAYIEQMIREMPA